MAVPKKRTSKSKKNLRKTIWKGKAFQESRKAFSLGVSELKKQEEKEGETEDPN